MDPNILKRIRERAYQIWSGKNLPEWRGRATLAHCRERNPAIRKARRARAEESRHPGQDQ